MTFEALPDRDGGTTVLRATGDLDVAVVPALLPEVPALVSAAGSVVLDLSAVTFFDSSGVRLVDRLARECGARATPFRVVAPPGGPTRRVLELVGTGRRRSPATTWRRRSWPSPTRAEPGAALSGSSRSPRTRRLPGGAPGATRSPRNSSPCGKNRSSSVSPPATGSVSIFAIQAPMPSG